MTTTSGSSALRSTREEGVEKERCESNVSSPVTHKPHGQISVSKCTRLEHLEGRARRKDSQIPRWDVVEMCPNGPPAGPLEVEERARSSTHYLLYPPSHYPTTYTTLPRPAQHHHPASATNRSRAHPQAHTRSQREQRRHPTISRRNRCARTVKRPGGPVPALLQNSD